MTQLVVFCKDRPLTVENTYVCLDDVYWTFFGVSFLQTSLFTL